MRDFFYHILYKNSLFVPLWIALDYGPYHSPVIGPNMSVLIPLADIAANGEISLVNTSTFTAQYGSILPVCHVNIYWSNICVSFFTLGV